MTVATLTYLSIFLVSLKYPSLCLLIEMIIKNSNYFSFLYSVNLFNKIILIKLFIYLMLLNTQSFII